MLSKKFQNNDSKEECCPECSAKITSTAPAHRINKILQKLYDIFSGYQLAD
jgi:hypothetical protein